MLTCKRERVGRNKRVWNAEFYKRARRQGRCRDCGCAGVVIGRHPEGKTVGEVLRAFRDNLKGLKEWIRLCGWQCHRCRTRGAGGVAGVAPRFLVSPERGVGDRERRLLRDLREEEKALKNKASAIRKALAPTLHQWPWGKDRGYKRGPLTVESVTAARDRILWQQTQGCPYTVQDLERAGAVDGSYMDPEKLQALQEARAACREDLVLIAEEIVRATRAVREAEAGN